MPRRKRKVESEEEESSYEDEGGSSNNDSEHIENDDAGGDDDDDDDNYNDDHSSDGRSSKNDNGKRKKSKTTVKEEEEDDEAPRAISKRPSKRKKKSYNTVSPNDLLPSHARKTKHGGYAHTNKSKSKISQANTGNTPWNKGKNRSTADRAKIAAGVRARNRAILLEKLKRLGMSEEEWITKKREIKYLRERVRRAKLSKKKHDASEAEMKLKAADAERKLKAAIEATTEKPGSRKRSNSINQKAPAAEDNKVSEVAEEIFSKDVEWTPFSFDEQGSTYDKACPAGGPGGFVCCEDCAEKYTLYLSGTVKDMEKHRASRNGREVQELLKFLKQGRETLENAYNVAKKKIPPLPPASKGVPKPATSSRKVATAASAPTQWNMTSAIDVALAKGSATPI